eukprot:g485.t1
MQIDVPSSVRMDDESRKKFLESQEEEYVKMILAAKRPDFEKLFETDKGRLVLEKETEHQRRLRRSRNAKLKTLPPGEQKVQRIKNKFLIYDIDDDGFIDQEEFLMMAKDLCISSREKSLKAAFVAMDIRCEVKIDFETFHAWYLKDGKRKASGFGGIVKTMSKRSQSIAGSIDSTRAKRALVKQCMDRARVDAVKAFREKSKERAGDTSEDDGDKTKAEGNSTTAQSRTVAAACSVSKRERTVDDDDENNSEIISEAHWDMTFFFYLDHRGEIVGPVTGKKLLRIGNANTFIWYQGEDAWIQIKDQDAILKWVKKAQWFVVDVLKKKHDGPFLWGDIEKRDDYNDDLFVWQKGMLTWRKVGSPQVKLRTLSAQTTEDSDVFGDL